MAKRKTETNSTSSGSTEPITRDEFFKTGDSFRSPQSSSVMTGSLAAEVSLSSPAATSTSTTIDDEQPSNAAPVQKDVHNLLHELVRSEFKEDLGVPVVLLLLVMLGAGFVLYQDNGAHGLRTRAAWLELGIKVAWILAAYCSVCVVIYAWSKTSKTRTAEQRKQNTRWFLGFAILFALLGSVGVYCLESSESASTDTKKDESTQGKNKDKKVIETGSEKQRTDEGNPKTKSPVMNPTPIPTQTPKPSPKPSPSPSTTPSQTTPKTPPPRDSVPKSAPRPPTTEQPKTRSPMPTDPALE